MEHGTPMGASEQGREKAVVAAARSRRRRGVFFFPPSPRHLFLPRPQVSESGHETRVHKEKELRKDFLLAKLFFFFLRGRKRNCSTSMQSGVTFSENFSNVKTHQSKRTGKKKVAREKVALLNTQMMYCAISHHSPSLSPLKKKTWNFAHGTCIIASNGAMPFPEK